jgi:DNA processing protein
VQKRVVVRLERTEVSRVRLRLALLKGIPRARLLEILEKSGTPERVFSHGASEAASLSLSSTEASLLARDVSGEIEEQSRLVELVGAGIVAWTDTEYPTLLRYIYPPPLALFWRGDLSALERPTMAVVGSRKCSPSGRAVAEKLGRGLAAEGFAVVSGLARGIDTAAHRGALAAGGRTVAVLGCGVDVCYPAENRRLLAEILKTGAAISEFPMGSAPLRQNFPMRNRIVSGLSLGVVVVEAGETSGALVTVNHALAQGRDVFVLPGDTALASTIGSNRLLREGARPVTGVRDILEELSPEVLARLEQAGESGCDEESVSGEEDVLLGYLSHEATHVDDICKRAGLHPPEALALLLALELKGYVRQEAGNRFLRVLKS